MSVLKYLAIPSINGRNTQANKLKIIAFTKFYVKYLRDINTTIVNVKNDKKVDNATVSAMLLYTLLVEYIFAIKYVSTADGIDAWINITPASTPERLKKWTK